MLTENNLTSELFIDSLVSENLSQKDKVLLIITWLQTAYTRPYYVDLDISLNYIRDTGASYGLREITKWNLSRILRQDCKRLAVKIGESWGLTSSGVKYVRETLLPNDPSSITETALHLRSYLEKISNPDTREFVAESIGCLDAKLFRPAVIMSWVGAMSVLYDYVVANRLADFNIEAKLRNPKWKRAITNDDLAVMKESDFLDILAHLSILGKNVKEHLKNNCLHLRNSCGHPTSLKPGKHLVEAHIEFLILNVYEKF